MPADVASLFNLCKDLIMQNSCFMFSLILFFLCRLGELIGSGQFGAVYKGKWYSGGDSSSSKNP